MVKEIEKEARNFLSDIRVWGVVLFLFIIFVVCGGVWINNNASDAKVLAAKEAAIRISGVQASAKSRFTQCIASIPELVKVNNFALAIQAFGQAAIDNSKSTLDNTSLNDPNYKLRQQNYNRLVKAEVAVKLIHFVPPTTQDCQNQADAILEGSK